MKSVAADTAPAPLTAGSATRLGDFVALTKPRLNALVVATTAAGYYLGAPGGPDVGPMLVAVAGTTLVAAGSAVLNQVYERDTDGLMRRTRLRPLPDRRLGIPEATVYGAVLSAVGLGLLAFGSNALAASIAAATLLIYIAVYTPMKRRSAMATLVGAVPGALPPLIGWAAALGSVSAGGWSLFAIVFLWQIPHFMAIAWLYREDYGQAGFPMLPVIEPDGARTGRQAVAYSAALIPTTLVPTLARVSGHAYYAIAMVLGLALLWLAIRFHRERTERAARLLFFGSIIYLPLLWLAMIVNHT